MARYAPSGTPSGTPFCLAAARAQTGGMVGRVRRGFFWVLKNTLNRGALRLARRGVGPFYLLRHTGRRSGREFEVPLILAPVADGLVAELTYGENVNWYRNVVASGSGTVLRGRRKWRVVAVEPMSAEAGLAAFGGAPAVVLRLLGKREFRLLRTASDGA
ncbi:PNPOx family protein [Herbiconiux daphne]|uniref:Nitroreductase family deazaflavin-dependent oxidoreductase n=1 Tax=Herbiconiux daphne TaxID=2970914 RepID=A0ABT2H1K3_9MICO|nr:nitroreductase family deazaflavin-dependent oxidoreductase [Herbiconiux daphne]MCS5733815.1 nitroreductase family deazaflavin-dependent oxidoreductase [Herbiconiux daphne]